MKIPLVLSIVTATLFTQAAYADDVQRTTSFDDFCALITQSMKLDLDAQQRHEYILEHLDRVVDNKDIKDAYSVIFQIDPQRRYLVFKNVAESELGVSWSCIGLKNYFDQFLRYQ